MSETDPAPYRVLVVGDVHGHWGDADARFLEDEGQDLVLFVGDLGDEDPEIVEDIASLDCEIAVLLGNHDAWQSFSNKRVTRRLRQSLDLLGEDHLAYAVRDLPEADITLLGARPFSWGGRDLRSPEIYDTLYGVQTPEDSAARIAEVAATAGHRNLLVLAHNGPHGLGAHSTDIYGKDFGKSPMGDWGDRDLHQALRDVRAAGRHVRAVVAGHMHDRLLNPRGAQRTRFVEHAGTAYVNPAVVPRIRGPEGAERRHFVELRLAAGRLVGCDEIWIDGAGEIVERTTPTFEPRRPRS